MKISLAAQNIYKSPKIVGKIDIEDKNFLFYDGKLLIDNISVEFSNDQQENFIKFVKKLSPDFTKEELEILLTRLIWLDVNCPNSSGNLIAKIKKMGEKLQQNKNK